MTMSLPRRLAAVAATVSLMWPAPAEAGPLTAGPLTAGPLTAGPLTAKPLPAEANCPPGSDVGMDDYIVWVDDPSGGDSNLPVRVENPCGVNRTLTYRTFDLSAKAGEDYAGVEHGTVELRAGSTSTAIKIRILRKPPAGTNPSFGIELLSGAKFSDPEAIITLRRR